MTLSQECFSENQCVAFQCRRTAQCHFKLDFLVRVVNAWRLLEGWEVILNTVKGRNCKCSVKLELLYNFFFRVRRKMNFFNVFHIKRNIQCSIGLQFIRERTLVQIPHPLSFLENDFSLTIGETNEGPKHKCS